jgi:2'-5' RNA ligase
VDHVVVPLDASHRDALAALGATAAAAADLDPAQHCPRPHITLVAFSPPADSTTLEQVVSSVASKASPFTVHAHGFGFFCGDHQADVNLHVDVVRGRRLNILQRSLCAALRRAGAQIAPWCEPERWTPHVTLLDHGLDAHQLGDAAAWLSRHHHPSWTIPVDRLAITGGWDHRGDPGVDLPIGRCRAPTSTRGS